MEAQMRVKHAMVALAVALPLMTGHGEAQEIGQPSRGAALARQLCAECHAIQKEYARSPNSNAPRFQVICVHARHDRDGAIGRAQYVTSLDAERPTNRR